MRIGRHEIESIAQQTADVVRAGGLSFRRGDPLEHMRKLARLNAALTLPLDHGSRARDAVLLKVLYTLWNYTIDDQVDHEHTTAGLDASTVFLLRGAPDPGGSSDPACKILDMMSTLLPAGALSRAKPIGFDLCEVLHGLNHEWFINRNRSRSTVFEYRRYSTMSASLKVLLDIDWTLADRTPDDSTYRTLREAYDELTLAVKLASDIGTLRREVHDEDNLNMLLILAGSAAPHERTASRDPEKIMADALRHRDDVAAWALGHLGRASALFGQVDVLDASTVLDAARRIVEVYISGVDPFFE